MKNPFEDNSQDHALWQAIADCAKEAYPNKEGNDQFYSFLENTPKTSLVVFVREKLNENGYQINPQ